MKHAENTDRHLQQHEALSSRRETAVMMALLILLLSPCYSSAQKDLRPEEIEVVKDYTPLLADAVKINFPATVPDRNNSGKLELLYSTPEKLLTVPFEPSPLKPLAIGKEKPVLFPSNYFKLGVGTQVSVLAEILWNDITYKNDVMKYNYGFFARHHHQHGFKLDNQNFNEDHLSVFGNYFTRKARINSEIFYHREGVRYYGYDHDSLSLERKDVKQHFNNFTWKTGITNISVKSKVEYHFKAGFTQFGSGSDIRESNPWFSLNLSKVFRSKHYVTVKLVEDYSRFKRVTAANRNILTFKPMYEFNDQIWKVFGGIDLTWETGSFHFFPELGFERQLYEQYIVMYSGWRMELKRTSYQTLTDDNPWLGNNFDLRNSWFEDRYAGFKGTVKDFSYNLRMAQKLVRRLPLFITDSTDTKKFTIVYDPRTIILNFHGELFFHATQNLNFSATLEYNHYEMDDVAKPWHLPNFVFDFNTQYVIKKKLYLTLDLLARDGVDALLPNGTIEKLSGTFDINLGANYKFNKHFSFFLTINNLASIKHEKYYMYPSYGFNGLIGAMFTY